MRRRYTYLLVERKIDGRLDVQPRGGEAGDRAVVRADQELDLGAPEDHPLGAAVDQRVCDGPHQVPLSCRPPHTVYGLSMP